MEERPPIWRVAANVLSKQSRTADKEWSSSLGVGRGANNFSLQSLALLRNRNRYTRLGLGLMLRYVLRNGNGTCGSIREMLGACIGQVHLQK
jgi:hypothetical protein